MAAAGIDAGSYKEVILFLGTAGIVVPLFTRIKVSPVLGFIGAGALFGPYGLGRFGSDVPGLRWFTIPNSSEVSHLAELGVVFLLFTIGLELSWERLRTLRRLVFGLGAAQVALSAAVLGTLGLAFGLSPLAAGIAGIALALSSTAIIIPILAGQRRLNSPTGRASFSVLLFQDLAVAPVLFTITSVQATGPGGGAITGLLLALVQAGIALAVIVAVGRLALRPLFQLVAQTRSPEMFMAACFLIVVGSALVAATSGLSMALGAFVAGLLLAETEYRRAVEAVVEPFKGLLLGIFFMSVGMGLDLTELVRSPGPILAAAFVVMVLKAGIVFLLSTAFRLPPRVGLEAGLLLGAGGEFAFVLLGAALSAKLFPADEARAALVVTSLTMIAIPALARIGRKLGKRVAAASPMAQQMPAPEEVAGRVVVAGYGRVGQLVSDMLTRHDVPWIAIDANPAAVAAGRGAGRPVYFGDTTSPSMLQASGLSTARALVITLDAPSAIQLVVEAARAARPDLTIVARARDAKHARQLYQLGVNDAVPETIEASLQLSEAVLVDIGVATGPVIASIHERRDEFRRILQRGADEESPRQVGEFRARRTSGKKLA